MNTRTTAKRSSGVAAIGILQYKQTRQSDWWANARVPTSLHIWGLHSSLRMPISSQRNKQPQWHVAPCKHNAYWTPVCKTIAHKAPLQWMLHYQQKLIFARSDVKHRRQLFHNDLTSPKLIYQNSSRHGKPVQLSGNISVIASKFPVYQIQDFLYDGCRLISIETRNFYTIIRRAPKRTTTFFTMAVLLLSSSTVTFWRINPG